jgi:hypothetical protein
MNKVTNITDHNPTKFAQFHIRKRQEQGSPQPYATVPLDTAPRQEFNLMLHQINPEVMREAVGEKLIAEWKEAGKSGKPSLRELQKIANRRVQKFMKQQGGLRHLTA